MNMIGICISELDESGNPFCGVPKRCERGAIHLRNFSIPDLNKQYLLELKTEGCEKILVVAIGAEGKQVGMNTRAQ